MTADVHVHSVCTPGANEGDFLHTRVGLVLRGHYSLPVTDKYEYPPSAIWLEEHKLAVSVSILLRKVHSWEE